MMLFFRQKPLGAFGAWQSNVVCRVKYVNDKWNILGLPNFDLFYLIDKCYTYTWLTKQLILELGSIDTIYDRGTYDDRNNPSFTALVIDVP